MAAGQLGLDHFLSGLILAHVLILGPVEQALAGILPDPAGVAEDVEDADAFEDDEANDPVDHHLGAGGDAGDGVGYAQGEGIEYGGSESGGNADVDDRTADDGVVAEGSAYPDEHRVHAVGLFGHAHGSSQDTEGYHDDDEDDPIIEV